MQDTLNSSSDDEIDLVELFMALWAYKFFIASTLALGLVFGGYKALTTSKVFSSIAIFRLDDNRDSGIKLGGDMGDFAALSGLSSGNKSTPGLRDQFYGRIFIEDLDNKLNFQADPYFNRYKPKGVDPIWKLRIKRAIGWQDSSIDPQEAIWQSITKNYNQIVTLENDEDEAIKIVVSHGNAQRSAEIANSIMNQIIFNTTKKRNTSQDQHLSYLSNTLAEALDELEVSQADLKEFALENSALPLESFAAGSVKLGALRDQLNRTFKLHAAVAELSLILQNKQPDQNDYLSLRQKFPIIDQVEFRRVLGQNEIVSSWSWPKASSVVAVLETLSERKSRLQTEINASQIDAERSSKALETYAKLERNAKISEAAYTILIEQVKAQSMLAGYRPDKTEIYEYASIPIYPSAPKRIRILAKWGALGLFIGAILAIIYAKWRGVYYTKRSLLTGAQAQLTLKGRSLKLLRNKSLNDLYTMLIKKPRSILRDIAVEIHKSNVTQVVVTSSRSKLTSNDVAKALAIYMQSDKIKVAIINFSSRERKQDTDDEKLSDEPLVVADISRNVTILKPRITTTAMELLSERDFRKNIHLLNSTFDLIFLCADNDDAISLLNALEGQKMFHLTLARIKKTRSNNLKHMRSLLAIQGLIYD